MPTVKRKAKVLPDAIIDATTNEERNKLQQATKVLEHQVDVLKSGSRKVRYRVCYSA